MIPHQFKYLAIKLTHKYSDLFKVSFQSTSCSHRRRPFLLVFSFSVIGWLSEDNKNEGASQIKLNIIALYISGFVLNKSPVTFVKHSGAQTEWKPMSLSFLIYFWAGHNHTFLLCFCVKVIMGLVIWFLSELP